MTNGVGKQRYGCVPITAEKGGAGYCAFNPFPLTLCLTGFALTWLMCETLGKTKHFQEFIFITFLLIICLRNLILLFSLGEVQHVSWTTCTSATAFTESSR